MGYENYPQACGHVVSRVYKELKKPILVTENENATSNDEDRCVFIKEALAGLKEAMNQGADVLGYLHWSFCDKKK